METWITHDILVMHFLFISWWNRMKYWYKRPVSLSFEVSFTFTTAFHETWLIHFCTTFYKKNPVHLLWHSMWHGWKMSWQINVLMKNINIPCDINDTFSAFLSIINVPHYRETLLFWNIIIIISRYEQHKHVLHTSNKRYNRMVYIKFCQSLITPVMDRILHLAMHQTKI